MRFYSICYICCVNVSYISGYTRGACDPIMQTGVGSPGISDSALELAQKVYDHITTPRQKTAGPKIKRGKYGLCLRKRKPRVGCHPR